MFKASYGWGRAVQLVANCQPTRYVQVGRRTPTCVATRAGRSLSSRRWTTRRLGDRAVLGIRRIAREHPLAHSVCSQLLRILYLAELDGIDSHGYNRGRGRLGDERGCQVRRRCYKEPGTCIFKSFLLYENKAPFGTGRTSGEGGFTGGAFLAIDPNIYIFVIPILGSTAG